MTPEQLRAAANKGDIVAKRELGLLLMRGKHVTKNTDEAFTLLKAASDAGDQDAHVWMCLLIMRPEFSGHDIEKGWAMLNAASKRGFSLATYMLGMTLVNMQKYAAAINCFYNASLQGSADANALLGPSANSRDFTRQQMQDITAKIKANAEAGSVEDQRALGFIYFFGFGGIESLNAPAVEWFVKAADAGDAVSSHYAGVIYRNGGTGVPASPALAVKYLLFAAERGGLGQSMLADVYLEGGEGVPPDPVEHVVWKTIALRRIREGSSQHLELEKVKARLSAEQLAEAEKRLAKRG